MDNIILRLYAPWSCSLATSERKACGSTFDPGSKRELPGHDDGLVRLHPTFDHRHVAVLALPGLHLSEIDCVVWFHHENERTILANLHCL